MKQNRFIQYTVGVCLTLTFCLVALLGVYDFILPDRVSYREGEAAPVFFGLSCTEAESVAAFADGQTAGMTTTRAELRLLGLPLKQVDLVKCADIRLYPGGMPFGVKLYTEGVLVVGFGDVDSESGAVNPAYQAGLRVKDVITHLNGHPLQSVDGLTAMIEAGGGAPIAVTYTRGSEVFSTTVTPVRSVSEGKYKTGMWVRDSGAGIGTVTFIDPTTGAFGGLGHGICDVDTGELMPMQRGTVVDVTINGVVPGAPGAPGELRGSFLAAKRGALIRNTTCGVFGVFSSLPAAPEEPLPIALKDEIRAGEAYIWCTLDENGPCRYAVELSSINKGATGSKCFVVKVTDPALLEKTGGIVQGMSGSPILQNGRIVGAVTHVLINQPDTGYGIFIENMLTSMPDVLG
ncbi:MAG: SpoIVB peptidase [Clostridia bacterium]|nr:SpoIVB peptidase [Clostridia bacterium]